MQCCKQGITKAKLQETRNLHREWTQKSLLVVITSLALLPRTHLEWYNGGMSRCSVHLYFIHRPLYLYMHTYSIALYKPVAMYTWHPPIHVIPVRIVYRVDSI